MIDIVSTFQSAALIKEWVPVVGRQQILNFNLQNTNLADGQIVLMIDLPTCNPIIESGNWSRYNESIEVMILRKNEFDTVSSIAETDEQKYTRRLFAIRTLIDEFLQEVLICAASISASSIRYEFMLNISSASVDGVLASLTYEQWGQ